MATSSTTTTDTFGGTSTALPAGAGTAGVTGGGVQTTASTTVTSAGTDYTYAVVVQVPIPFANITPPSAQGLINLVLAQATPLHVPQAMTWLQTNAAKLFQYVVDDATDLVKFIPQAAVSLQVKVGAITLFSVKLVAQPTPTPIPLPSFKLGLPNLAVDLNLASVLTVPTLGSPIVESIPIPVPVVTPAKILQISGGNVSASAKVSTGASGLSAAVSVPVPPGITNPISLPSL